MSTTSTGSWPTSPTTRSSRRRAGRSRGAQRFVGRDAIRGAFAAASPASPTFATATTTHFVDGDRGASEWTLSGTTTDGQRIEVRGCDLWTFRDGKIVKKDSFWKIRRE